MTDEEMKKKQARRDLSALGKSLQCSRDLEAHKRLRDIHKAIAISDLDPATESHQQPPLGHSDANPEQH